MIKKPGDVPAHSVTVKHVDAKTTTKVDAEADTEVKRKRPTGVTSIEPQEISADPTWVDAQQQPVDVSKERKSAVSVRFPLSNAELSSAARIAGEHAERKDPNVLHRLVGDIEAAAKAALHPAGVGAWFDKHLRSAQERAPGVDDVKKVEDGGKAKGNYLMCPVLGGLIAEGSLKVDDKGDFSLKEFDELMKDRLGITPERAAVTVSTGFIGQHATDAVHVAEGKFNINHLDGSILDHRHHGDTGILQDGVFHEDKFQTLCSHSSDGKTMCIADFAASISDQLKRDDGVVTRTKGTSEDIFEMAALLNTFGYTDDKGERRISFDTMRDIYQNKKLPSKDELMARKPTGVADHVDTMAKIGIDMAKP